MVFASVGTQLPFDRMIRALDFWVKKHNVKDCFAQIGTQGIAPQYFPSGSTLTASQFAKRIADCKVIVSHAGMGTILTALQAGKPIIIMPRLARHGEHRNDHQLATCNNLRSVAGVHIADDETQLLTILDQLKELPNGPAISKFAQPALLQAVKGFIGKPAKGLAHA